MQYYLPIGSYFHFFISEINENKNTISLTRKEYLEQTEIPNYGDVINAKYVKENHSTSYFYSDELEGWANIPNSDISLGSSIEVILLSSSTGEYKIVE